MDSPEHAEDYGGLKYSLPYLWGTQSANYKNRNKNGVAYDTMASKCNVSVVEVEEKMQGTKTQFPREHRKLVVSKRS